MTVQPLTAEQWWLIAAVLGALFVASCVFNAWIDAQIDNDPEGTGSYFWVILGVTYTLLGAAIVLAFFFGAHTALWIAVITLVCFSASGLPMIFGDIRRNLRRREENHRRIERRAEEQAEQHIKDLGL